MSKYRTRAVAAAEDAAVAIRTNPFFDALYVAFQSERGRTGFAEDLRWAAGLCRTTWGEEQLWTGLVHVQRGLHKRTHLMYAAMMGDVERVRWLLARGAPMELKNDVGWTALMYVTVKTSFNTATMWTDEDDVVQALIAAGADVNTATNDGLTPIFITSHDGHHSVRALIAAGADINVAMDDGATPVYIASQNGHVDSVRALIADCADVNVAMDDGATPVYIASENGHVDSVRALISAGADVSAAANDGVTPADIASLNGHVEVLRALIEARGDE